MIGCVLSGETSYGQTPGLLLTGAKVLAPNADRLLDGQSVLIVGERITQVGPAGSFDVPGKVVKIDLSGFVMLPGLIDLHSHLLLHPYDEASWNDQVLKESLGLRTIRGVVAAQSTVEAGFTTLRDLGTEGAAYADVALRDAINLGLIVGPRVFTSTRAIVATGCYGPAGFDPRWDMPYGAQVADGIDGVRRVVREQIAAGADWIKVYADYRRAPGSPSTPTFSQDELDALVQEAKSAGLPVAAHASTNEGIRRAVLAGVQTIEHGYEASTEVLLLMKKSGVVLCPTLAAIEATSRYAGWNPGDPEPKRITAAKAMLTRARNAGVTIGCGSDVGVFSHGDNARELELMVEFGMTPTDALRSATTIAANVLHQSEKLGQIKVGFYADIILVHDNPLHDISTLRQPVLVIKNGKIVADRR